jgi:branched-subunit amino acid ABC-type transport system permease component
VPTHQHPPLHLWLVARAFRALGEHDLAARLPTALLALGTLVLTWRIGVLTVGRAAAVAATASLLATPIFVDNARRLMMEVPLTFWITATVWVYLEARGRPRWQIALAVPLGAAILTKSVLGLMPLAALVGVLASAELRAPLRRPWVWIGLGLGLAIGASWLAHQWWTQGSGAVASHFLAHVVRRSTRSFRLAALYAYPLILLKFYQPLIVPALVGLWLVLRRTDLGRTMRATADNPYGALVVGTNVRRVYATAFGIGAACVGAAGALVSPILPFSPSVGLSASVASFNIVIIGGMGSLPGAFAGGLLVSLAESLGAVFLSPSMKELANFGMLIVILLFRPAGLFGRRA